MLTNQQYLEKVSGVFNKLIIQSIILSMHANQEVSSDKKKSTQLLPLSSHLQTNLYMLQDSEREGGISIIINNNNIIIAIMRSKFHEKGYIVRRTPVLYALYSLLFQIARLTSYQKYIFLSFILVYSVLILKTLVKGSFFSYQHNCQVLKRFILTAIICPSLRYSLS